MLPNLFTTIYNAPNTIHNHLQHCQSAIGNFSTILSMKVSAVCVTPIGHLPQNCDKNGSHHSGKNTMLSEGACWRNRRVSIQQTVKYT